MRGKSFKLRKIPLLELIDILSQTYDRGADYVDIIGVPDNKGDIIQIQVLKEYMMKEDEELDVNKFKELL